MNWLTSFVRPKIATLLGRKEVPDNLWHKCPACEQVIFHRELDKSQHVCPHCSHHMRLPARKRLEYLFDDSAYTEVELPSVPADPLRFRDLRRYSDRLKESQAKTGLKDALLVAHGKIDGHEAVAAVFDFGFMGGSMGIAVGEALLTAARLAKLQNAPLIVFSSSGGARMQEGILSLMQMPRTTLAVRQVKEAGLPYIVVLCDPTTGGVTASFAMLGDIAVAEPGAVIGFAGTRVIQETIREQLPEGFQRAEYLHEHGMVDMVVKRGDLRATLARLIDLIRNPRQGLPAVTADNADPATATPAA
jgi:acetyl-CoA carboxylase carboxyl transferase subunit beta